MKRILTAILIIIVTSVSAQNAQIKGKIIDAYNNDPIPFANIIVKGTTIGTASDFDGNFIITGLTSGYINLSASFIGYQTKTSSDVLVSKNNIPFIEIKLEPSQNQLDEVVVRVDYTIKKMNYPAAEQRGIAKE